MKSLLKSRKLLSLVIGLALVLSAMGMAFAPSSALAAPSGEYLQGSAIPPSNSRDGSTYEITSPDKAESIKVTLIVEAGDEYFAETGKFWVSHDFTLSQSTSLYTVTDLLVAADGQYGLNFYDVSGDQISPTTNYVAAVEYAGTTWEQGQLAYDGWAFRVDDRVPVLTDGTGWISATILQTNIVSGDIVHLFYDFPADFSPASGSFAANSVRGVYVGSDRASLTVQLQGHTTFISPTTPADPPYYVDNYKNVQAGVNAYLYDSTGTTLLGSAVSNVNGRVTFSGAFAPGDYIVKTDSVYQPGYDPAGIVDDTYIALTGAYSRITIQ